MSFRKTLNIIVPFLLLITVFGIIINRFFDMAGVTLVKYILVQCLVVLAQGMVCVKYTFGDKETSVIHWITLSYALGYALNILEYIIIWVLNLQQYATYIVTIIVIIVCFLWFYKPIEIEFEGIKKDSYIILTIFMVYMVINIITYSGYNISPFVDYDGTSIVRDMQFWCDNAVALKRAFLPQSAYFSGTTFFYHYFSSIHVAFISQISGIPVFDVAFSLFVFGKCVLLIGALNYLIDRYRFGNLKYLFYACMLFMTGWEVKSVVTYSWHLTYNPFGFDIGFAFGIWFMAFFLNLIDNPEYRFREFCATMLIWIVLVGAKGPIAALLIIVPGLICFWWLFQKKFRRAFGYGIPILATFIIINVFCVGIIRVLNHTAEAKVENIGGFRTIYEVIAETPYAVRYRNIVPSLVWSTFYSHPALFLISAINTIIMIWLLISKRVRIKDCLKIGILLFAIAVGVILGRFYNAGGHSEMYFTMAAYIPCLAYNLEICGELYDEIEKKSKWMYGTYKAFFVLFSLIGIYCWCFTDYTGGAIKYIKTGYNRICGKWENESGSNSFSKREAEACVWIRDNTPQDSIIQSNRFMNYPSGSYFMGIFTERIQYLEETFLIYYCDLGIEEPCIESRETERRSEIINRAYNGDLDAMNQLIDEGVDYFVQDNQLDDDELSSMGLREVYKQNDIVIYASN